eukprot:TRINITY_DN663_c0_g1_i1.p1 TRINITY_DN663_c0_g1~~TRINITY_DN663_c0_g1_i1.p1  ORF type:complete len:991 (-),score=102.93 TRINITY_DN663_c0_g1_i1:3911-6883(-)
MIIISTITIILNITSYTCRRQLFLVQTIQIIMEGKVQQRVGSPPNTSSDAHQIDPVLEQNRPKFKKVFLTHSCADKMSFQEFFKFCKRSTLIPELATIMEVKQAYTKYTISHKLLSKPETTPVLSFTNFEELLQHLALNSIKTSETAQGKVEAFLAHIKGPVKKNYKQTLVIKRQQLSDKKLNPEAEGETTPPVLCAEHDSYPATSRPGSDFISRSQGEQSDKTAGKTPPERELRKSASTEKLKNGDVIDSNIDLALKVLGMPKKDSSKQLPTENLGSEKPEDPLKPALIPRFSHAVNGNNGKRYRNSYSNERLGLQLESMKSSFEQLGNKTGTHNTQAAFNLFNVKDSLGKEAKDISQDVVVQRIMDKGVGFTEENEELKEFLEIEQSLKPFPEGDSQAKNTTRFQEYIAKSPREYNTASPGEAAHGPPPKPKTKPSAKSSEKVANGTPKRRRDTAKSKGRGNKSKKHSERNALTTSPDFKVNVIHTNKVQQKTKLVDKKRNSGANVEPGSSFTENNGIGAAKVVITKINIGNSSFDQNGIPQKASTGPAPKTAKNMTTKGFCFAEGDGKNQPANANKNHKTNPAAAQQQVKAPTTEVVKSGSFNDKTSSCSKASEEQRASPDKLGVLQSFLDIKEKLLVSQASKIESLGKFLRKVLEKDNNPFEVMIKKALFISWKNLIKQRRSKEIFALNNHRKRLTTTFFYKWATIVKQRKNKKEKALTKLFTTCKTRLKGYFITINTMKKTYDKGLQMGLVLGILNTKCKNVLSRAKKLVLQKIAKTTKTKPRPTKQEREMHELQSKLDEENKKSKAYYAELQRLREKFGKARDAIRNWPQMVSIPKVAYDQFANYSYPNSYYYCGLVVMAFFLLNIFLNNPLPHIRGYLALNIIRKQFNTACKNTYVVNVFNKSFMLCTLPEVGSCISCRFCTHPYILQKRTQKRVSFLFRAQVATRQGNKNATSWQEEGKGTKFLDKFVMCQLCSRYFEPVFV